MLTHTKQREPGVIVRSGALESDLSILEPRPGWSEEPTRNDTCRATSQPVIATRPRRASIFDDLIDPVNHAGNVSAELKEKRPQDLEARSILDEDCQERQEETKNDEEDLYHLRRPARSGVSVT